MTITKARLEEINRKSGCLIPIPGAKSVITSHEKTFCDCTIKDLLAHIDDQERRLGIAENALNWIGAIEVAPKESWPEHKVIAGIANDALGSIQRDRGDG